MVARAQVKFVRGSASKIRQVIDLIRGMKADEALVFLKFVDKRPSICLRKALASAIANAKVKGLDSGSLVISKITADEGPRWKRFRAAAFGRASEILKRTSHINIELDFQPKADPPLAEAKKK